MKHLLLGRRWALKADVLEVWAAMPDVWPTPQDDPNDEDQPYQNIGGVAVITISGVLTKYCDLFCTLFGGCSTAEARDQIASALADPAVRAVLLYVDSPGGDVAGVFDVAELIAGATKPVWGYASDMAASGAYGILSQCDKIFANTTAQVGSIGVYAVLQDSSKLYENAGVSVKLVKAGDYKGVGVDGVPLDDSALADVQREIDDIYNVFVATVAKGRGFSAADANARATGQVWIAAKAQQLGLIDGIASPEEVLRMMGVTVNNLDIDASPITDSNQIKAEESAPVETDLAEEKTDDATETVDVEGQPITNSVGEPLPAEVVNTTTSITVKPILSADIAEQLKAARAEGYAEAIEHEKQRMAALHEICGTRPDLVVKEFLAGHDRGKAAEEFAKELQKELKENTRYESEGMKPLRLMTAAKGEAHSAEDFEREWDGSPELQKAHPNKKWYVAFRKFEAKKK